MRHRQMDKKTIFTDKMTVAEFNLHYWYKAELQDICRRHGLSPDGTKAELEQAIRAFISDEVHNNERAKTTRMRKSAVSRNPVSLQTRLINDGFKFNDEARKFFADYFGVAKFSFTKAMAVALREAEKNQDFEMTVEMKVAAILWSKVRDKPVQKKYDTLLVDKFIDEIEQYRK